MAAAAAPDHRVVFNLSLNDLPVKPMGDLTDRQQRKQMSRPFECHGMHWMLTIEKEPPTIENGPGFNILAYLYCLSVVYQEGKAGEAFPIRGDIVVDNLAQDGQARVFNAQRGIACNLVGKPFPASVVRMEGAIMSLRSGRSESNEIEVSMFSQDGGDFGGYYGAEWRGMGGVLLENHIFDGVRDGAFIEVSVHFLGTPRALRFVD